MSCMKGHIRPPWARHGAFARAIVVVLFAALSTTACRDAAGPEQLESLTLTAAASTVQPAATVQLTTTATRAGQDVTNLLGQTYAVASGGGTVSATGAFTAPTTAGTSVITVTCGGRTANVTITVVPGPLARITVTPNPDTLQIQTTQQFTAVGHDAFDNVVAITPVWSATNPPGTINAGTGLFTAGNTLGTFAAAVTATSGSISGSATVTVIAGSLATITVTPDPVTLAGGTQQQFTAVGRDAAGNPIPITPVWSTTNPPGTIDAGTGLFTAGNTGGLFNNSVRATVGTLFGTATVTVTVVIPPPPPAAGPRMIARVAWTCTNGTINGSVATNQAAGDVPPGSVTQTLCPITGTTDVGSPAAKQAYTDFLAAYAAMETTACGTTLTGTLDGVILAPGVYCFDNAATLTGTLTLSGTATDQWLIKVGAAGIPGALTTDNFNVVMAGGASACNVSWWVRQAATMTTSDFQGHILAAAGISFTGNTYKGNAWSQEDVTVTGAVVSACDAP
ncbi:MAG TPA: ice-binding family protein [Longimicrobiales bacterium]|nr:ice-binding family protein [Longimicrobiales bacterium]